MDQKEKPGDKGKNPGTRKQKESKKKKKKKTTNARSRSKSPAKNKKDSKQRVGRPSAPQPATEIHTDESMSFGDDFDPTEWL